MKRLVTSVAILLTFFTLTFAQRPTNNPFSRYGVGELYYQGFGQNLAMGHTGIAYYSQFGFSKLNPASYTAMGRQHVAFTFSFNIKANQFETQDSSIYSNIADMSHIAAVIPVMKNWYLSLGVQPYSGIGYNIRSYDTAVTGSSTLPYVLNYQGSGGINQFYIGTAIKPYKNLSLGTNAYFRWGTFDRLSSLYISENTFTESSTYDYTLINTGFAFDFGLLWNDTIINHEKRNVFNYSIGLTYSPASTLNGLEKRLITRNTQLFGINYTDTLVNDTILRYTLPLASSFGIGIAFKIYDIYAFEFNYSKELWNNLDVFDMSSLLKNSELYSFGFQYCKDPFSSRYFNRMRFRLGGFVHKTYLNLNNTPIDQYGITFGVGLPAHSAIVNLSFEIGTKGTLNNNLFKENYILFNLDLSMHDIWFIKRKYQ